MSDAHFGDGGKTRLASVTPIGKDDVRIEAIGAIEELVALLRYAAIAGSGPHCPTLSRLVATLGHLADYVKTGGLAVHLPAKEEIAFLEETAAKLTPL